MTTLVQATCPGCKKLLHIPVEWLTQPIKCKFCGLIMAAKPPAAVRIVSKVPFLRTAAGYAVAIGPFPEHAPDYARR